MWLRNEIIFSPQRQKVQLIVCSTLLNQHLLGRAEKEHDEPVSFWDIPNMKHE
jgi:hypothetical protein